MRKVLATTCVGLATCLVLGGCSIGSDEKISKDEFNQIETGMSYEDVCDIIGGGGTLASSSDIGMGSAYKTEIYQWEGNGSIGANANVTFQGGKVVSKAQAGLK